MTYSNRAHASAKAIGASLDDLLGPASERYLATRFRDVARTFVGSATPSSERRITLDGRAALRYPDAWTVKRSSRPAPHFSSIDAVVLVETVCAHFAERDEDSSASPPRLRSISLRAGTSADVELEGIPVAGTLDAPPSRTGMDARLTLGAMRAVAQLDHPPAFPHETPAEGAPLPLELAADGAGEHVWRSHLIRMDIGRSIEFRHEIVSTGDPAARRAVTVLDLLRLSAQQAQALIYFSDGLDRASANSIWMRSASFDVGEREPLNGPLLLEVSITRTQRIDRASVRWNVFDVVAQGTGDLRASASLAYAR
ncbi:AvrD family protein [Microbacterium arborescens]